ncbi:MAG: NAD+ synthase [Simkania sp.]|nr:NAD+ synthase [Simkania sp.]
MRVLVAQLNPTVGDLERNTQKIIEALDRARSKGSDIVLFPELTICGYPPEDLVLHSSFIDAMEMCLERIIQASYGLVVLVGLVRRNPYSGAKPLLNSVAVIEDGKLLGFQDKMLLPTYDVFDERRYFEPGTTIHPWILKGKKVGVIICEDIWQHAGYTGGTRYPCDPVLELQPHRIELLLNLSASPYQFQKPDVRVNVCSKAAQTLHCPVILCCQAGANDQLVFDGYSVYVDAQGKLRQLGKGFEEDDMVVDLNAPASACPFQYDPLQDLYKALVIGVRDYFHKSGFHKACLGLSGGIDSALVACIAKEALGKENVLCINMPSRYSSKEAIADAKQLAENLGVAYKQISIEEPFEDYLELLKPFFLGKEADVTEENLQARIRGMLLMAISNKLGYIVISTGNKSEMGMGYCTLYGDLAGGLAAISDVTKTQVYAIARWINRDKEIIPQGIIDRAPSAELRPGQKDSDSLPSYDIVDAVLQGYVEDYLSPQEISQRYKLPIELVIDLVKRIHRAEYKRRQAPPGIRVTKKAFRVGRRYPIVQGWL